MSERQNPDDLQMAIESSGDDAVGTSEDPSKHPEPVPDEERPASYADEAGGSAYPDEERPVPISDGDAVAGNPASGDPGQPDLPEDVGPDAVPPRNAETNEYDKE
jgi:hypothetical protein